MIDDRLNAGRQQQALTWLGSTLRAVFEVPAANTPLSGISELFALLSTVDRAPSSHVVAGATGDGLDLCSSLARPTKGDVLS